LTQPCGDDGFLDLAGDPMAVLTKSQGSFQLAL
jgi:hypothetical protein